MVKKQGNYCLLNWTFDIKTVGVGGMMTNAARQY